MSQVAAITTVRDDAVFLAKWLEYYSAELGPKNLFVILDGHDQAVPAGHPDVNFIRLPHVSYPRLKGDKIRAQVKSNIAAALCPQFKAVLGLDVDEFIAIDPLKGMRLSEYLEQQSGHKSLSPLGLDVVQHTKLEQQADFSLPLLSQREYAVISDRYTKPAILFAPLRWGAGQHRVKGHGYHIDKNLFLFHFGMVDAAQSSERTENTALQKSGWKNHMKRRNALFETVANSVPEQGDQAIALARETLQKKRRLTAWNKPKPLSPAPVIKLPGRFSTIL